MKSFKSYLIEMPPAYHGSPHEFDRFDLAHVNTGEGWQEYGWGLYFTSCEEIAEWYRVQLTKYHPSKGLLYHVELTPEINEFLDWDATFEEQSLFVKKALRKMSMVPKMKENYKFFADYDDSIDGLNSGEDFYKELTSYFKGSQKHASKFLLSLGIPGLKYIGRSSQKENYVIFDDTFVKIIKKYNLVHNDD